MVHTWNYHEHGTSHDDSGGLNQQISCFQSIHNTKRNHSHTYNLNKNLTWFNASYKLSYKWSKFNKTTVLPVSIQTLILLIFLYTWNKDNI